MIGLGLGVDGTSNWINKHVVDKLILGVDEFKPEEYSVGRKFLVLWVFLTIFTLLLYFTLCPLTYYLFYKKKDGAHGRNKADWDEREGKDQIANEIKLSAFSIVVMAGMTAPFELLVEAGYTKIYWVSFQFFWRHAPTHIFLRATATDPSFYRFLPPPIKI